MPKYTVLMRQDGAAKIMQDGKFYCILAMYQNTPAFKVQETAQKICDALNKVEESNG